MMNLKNKWSLVAGGVLIAGAVLTAGIAFAGTGASGAAATPAPAATPDQNRANWLDDAVKSGKITQAQADVEKQLDALRKSAMDKLQADEKAIIDQAVKDGKLTQAQADQMTQHHGPKGGGPMGGGFGGRGHGHGHGHGHDGKDGDHQPLTQAELKAKLDEQVKAGKITQAQEDQKLQEFANRQANNAQ